MPSQVKQFSLEDPTSKRNGDSPTCRHSFKVLMEAAHLYVEAPECV
jgi:hypothetical protein